MTRRKHTPGYKAVSIMRNAIASRLPSIKMALMLIAIASVPRLLVLIQSADSPLFAFPVIDSMVYHETARSIANGDIMGASTFWQAPLYPYFLGLVYWLAGISVVVAKIVGLILGAINCFLIFRLADAVGRKRVAWTAYVISVLYGPFIFFDLELLAPALLNFLLLLALLTIESYRKSSRVYKIIGIGFILSLAQVGHGLTAVFLPFIIGWVIILHRHKGEAVKKGISAATFLLLGFLPPITATAVHNYVLDREFVPVSYNFGPNLYLGNHPNYDSTVAIRPGLEWDEFMGEASVAGYNTPAGISNFYFRRAADNIVTDIPAFAGLMARKIYLLTAGEEIKRNLDIYYFKKYSGILDVLIWRRGIAFPSGLVIPLAISGMLFFLIRRRPDKWCAAWWLMLLYLISQAAAILLFFVSTRYRLVMMPVAIIFAAAAIWQARDWLGQRQVKPLVYFAILFSVLLMFCNLPRIEPTAHDRAENLFYEGLALSGGNDFAGAMKKYQEALEYYPNYSMSEYNLALTYDRLGMDSAAREAYLHIIDENPNSFMTRMIVGNSMLTKGQLDEAKTLFEHVLEINPNAAEAHVNLAYIYRMENNMPLAMQHLSAALTINPRAFKAYNQIAAIHLSHNRLQQAEQNFRKALDINPSYASAMNNLATVCSRTNRVEEAKRLLETAVTLEPDNPEFLINYAAIKVMRGDIVEGLTILDRAVAIAPDMPETHFYRGIALLRMGKRRDAVRAFVAAFKADSTFEPARKELKDLGY